MADYLEYTKGIYNGMEVYPPIPPEPFIGEKKNPSRGLLFALGVGARAIAKPFALLGAVMLDVTLDVLIKGPLDLGKGLGNFIGNLFKKEAKNQSVNINDVAPSSSSSSPSPAPTDVELGNIPPPSALALKEASTEATTLAGGLLDANWAEDQKRLLEEAETPVQEHRTPGKPS